jgi:hypothetical protein
MHISPRVEREINPRFNPGADDAGSAPEDHGAMTTTEYLINAAFVLIVFRQARGRELDLRSLVVPLVLVAFVAHAYIRAIPTAGNDLVLVSVLAVGGLVLGVVSGLATHVRAGSGGVAIARLGWLAVVLLIAGISSRMVFALATSNGAEPAVRSFSIAHHIGAAAWPVALVLMAVLEVTARVVIVQLRGRRVTSRGSATALGAAA